MPFQPVPDTIRVELIYSWDAQVVENVLHYRSGASFGTAGLTSLAENVLSVWNTSLRPLISSAVSLTVIKLTLLESEFAPGIEYVTGLPIPGTASGNVVPANVTVAVRFLTALRGRSYRGRVYQIGMTSTQVSGNEITTAFSTALRNAWIQMIDVGSTPETHLTVVSRVQGGVLRPQGVATDVTGITIERVLDSQRRRLPKRGE